MNEDIQKNLSRCGEYLMLSIWIQSQLSDLIILNKNKEIINDFVSNPDKIPLVLKNERYVFWKKDFGEVKAMFETEFSTSLTDQAKADLDTVLFMRNAIGHSHVSLARPFIFYVPSNSTKEEKFRNSFDILNKDDDNKAQPTVFKMNFSNDMIYFHNRSSIDRLDEIFLKKVCKQIGISHERIR